MQWYDGVAVGATAIDLVLVIYAIVQLRRTRDVVEETQRHLAQNHILTLLPQLQWIEQDLEAAVKDDNRDMCLYLVAVWRRQAGTLRGILDDDLAPHQALASAIDNTLELSGNTKTGLREATKPILVVTKSLMKSIASVTSAAAVLSGSMASHVGPTNRKRSRP
jgi:hypothetical protein